MLKAVCLLPLTGILTCAPGRNSNVFVNPLLIVIERLYDVLSTVGVLLTFSSSCTASGVVAFVCTSSQHTSTASVRMRRLCMRRDSTTLKQGLFSMHLECMCSNTLPDVLAWAHFTGRQLRTAGSGTRAVMPQSVLNMHCAASLQALLGARCLCFSFGTLAFITRRLKHDFHLCLKIPRV